MYPIYKFTLFAGTANERRVYPIYSALTKEWSQESGERFFREQLSGNLTFAGPDYTFIKALAFGTKIPILVSISQDAGATWENYWRGQFTITDCEVNEDDKEIKVTPSPIDQYTEILNGIEKEFDIVSLKPAMAQVRLDKRPMLQVYRTGERVIGCWLGNMWWEQDCEAVTDTSELERCGFSRCASISKVAVTGTLTPDATGSADITTATPNFSVAVGGYTLDVSSSIIGSFGGKFFHEYIIKLTVNESNYWQLVFVEPSGSSSPRSLAGDSFTLAPYGSVTGNAVVSFPVFDVFARILTDAMSYSDSATSPIPADDMAGMASVYSRVIGYSDSDAVIVSSRMTSTPTEYGLYSPGRYYQYPATAQLGAAAFPMARNSWDFFSIWFVEPVIDIETYGVTEYTIKDAYPLGDVISTLLAQIDPGVSFAVDALHSLFLSGQSTPSFNYPLFITPKSNAIAAGYDTPAQKGVITLRQVFDMLRDCFRCYWYVDSGNQLHIEHVRYFDNGMSYSGAGVQIDLTTLTILRNGKTWGTATSRYKFDKQSLPARYQFAWMDTVTRLFNGLPIDIISNYIQEGQVEQIQAMQFTSDVDFMRCNPSGVSRDGFALLCARASGDSYKVPYWNITVDDTPYKLQNGPLSFYYLEMNFYPYDLPASSYKINGTEYTAAGTKKPKSQEVIFPSFNDPNPMQLITTPLGNGSIEKLSVNLQSREVKATLKYGAE